MPLTKFSSEFPSAPAAFKRTLEKVTSTGKVTSNHLSQLVDRVRLSPNHLTLGGFEGVRNCCISIDKILIGQKSSIDNLKFNSLCASVGLSLKKMPPSDLEALRKEMCEEGNRKTERYKSRLEKALAPKKEAIQKLRALRRTQKEKLELNLNLLSKEKKALARQFIDEQQLWVFQKNSAQMEKYFPGNYREEEVENKWGEIVVERTRIWSSDEIAWLEIGVAWHEYMSLGRRVDDKKSEVEELLLVETDSLNFPIETWEQKKLLSESDRSRRDTALDNALKDLIVKRLNAVSKK